MFRSRFLRRQRPVFVGSGKPSRRPSRSSLWLEELEARTLLSFIPTSYNIGSSFARTLVAGDFNGDGRPDLISGASSSALELLNNGDGTFQTPAQDVTISSSLNGLAVTALTAADVDRDGRLDLVAANADFVTNQDETVSVLLGNGNGTFRNPQEFSVGTTPVGVAMADFDRDGIPDVVTANQGSDNVGVLLGNGDGQFRPQQTFAAGARPVAVVASDVDDDGKTDLVTATGAGSSPSTGNEGVNILLGNGDGSFRAPRSVPVGGPVSSLVAADVNRDGRPDFVTSFNVSDPVVGPEGTTALRVLAGNGDGSFQPRPTFSYPDSLFTTAVADVNADGRPDLITSGVSANQTGLQLVLDLQLGNGDGSFQAARRLPVGPSSFFFSGGPLAVTDVSGDGRPDLVAGNGTGFVVLVNDGAPPADGTFPSSRQTPTATALSWVTAADLDADGRSDLVTADGSSDSVGTRLGNGDGTFQPARQFAAGADPAAVTVTDLDGDQKLDLAVTAPNGVGVLLGRGDGTFRDVQFADAGVTPGGQVSATTVADVNADGSADLLVTLTSSGAGGTSTSLNLLLGNGNGTFQAAQTVRGNLFFLSGVAVGDVNGDHKADLITAEAATFTPGGIMVALGNGDGTFQTAQTVRDGTTLFSLLLADDVDGDGDLDLLTNETSGVTVLLGNGDGGFRSAPSIAGSAFLAPVTLADFNRDGRRDLVLASSGSMAVLLGNGDGTFQPPVGIGEGGYPVTAADVNGDQLLDLVTLSGSAGSAETSVRLILGNGDGTFRAAGEVTGVSGTPTVVTDVNADGLPDLVAADFFNPGVSVSLGRGDASFQPAQVSATDVSSTSGLVSADLDGDGRGELIASNFNGDLSVLSGNGDGTFRVVFTSASVGLSSSVLVGDVTGDGTPDLVDSVTRGLVVLPGNGDRTFQSARDLPGGPASSFALSDVNSDGRRDLVVISSGPGPAGLYLLLGNGDGTFSAPRPLDAGFGPTQLTTTDLNGSALDADGDGKPDLLVSTENGLHLLLGNGDGAFQPFRQVPVGGEVSLGGARAADLNGDQAPDLIVSTFTDWVILLGNGDGTFQAPRPETAAPFSIVAAVDLNGDGNADLVGPSTGSNAVSFLLGNGDGTFVTGDVIPSSGFSPTTAVVGDVNRDGKPDAVTLNKQDNTLAVFLNQGDGSFQPPQTFTAGTGANAVVLEDVNRDGRPDLAVPSTDANGVRVFLGNGDGSFQSARFFPSGRTPVALAAADLNRDGRPDLVTANIDDGTVSVLLGNGDGTFQPFQVSAAGPGPSSVAVVDLDGDGALDLVVFNRLDLLGRGRVSVLLGNGDGTFRAGQTTATPDGLSVPTVADFNADGKPDLVGTTASGLGVLFGQGNGTFQTARSFDTDTQFANIMAAEDVDGDRVLDLILYGIFSPAGFRVLLGNGDGTFRAAGDAFGFLPPPNATTVADLNGDGRQDLLAVDSQGLTTYLGNRNSATQFAVTGLPLNATAGQTVSFTVHALVAGGRTDANYTGTITISSSVGRLAPLTYTFTPQDLGAHTFELTLDTAGLQSLIITDGSIHQTSAVIAVVPGPADHLAFLQQPGDGTAGTRLFPFISVQVLDALGNVVTGYSADMTLAVNGGAFAGGSSATVVANAGVATFTDLAFDAAGTYTLSATTPGLPALESNSFAISATGTTTALSTSATLALAGQPVTLTATVVGPGAVTGSVTFRDGGTSLGTVALVNGTADLVLDSLALGVHSLTAEYGGDGGHTKSTSAVLSQAVTDALTKKVWDGGAGADNRWTNPVNWQGDVAPSPGDDLVFPDGALTFNPVDDFAPGTAFRSLTFTGANPYTVNGNALALGAGGIVMTSASGGNATVQLAGITLTSDAAFIAPQLTVAGPVDLNGFTLTLDHTATSAGGGTGFLSGVVSGSGAIVKQGAGTWQLSAANTYAGPTTVNAGALLISHNSALGDPGTGTTVNSGGSLQVFNNLTLTEPLTINGTGNNISPGAIHVRDINGNDTFGDITLGSDSTIFSATGLNRVTLAGTVANNGHDLTLASIFQTVLTGTITGGGNLLDFSTIFSGTGTIAGSLNIREGQLRPGVDGPGLLTAGGVSFNTGTSFHVTLAGTTPGSGFSKLLVNGGVDLSGSSLTGTLLNFMPAQGDEFVIVESTESLTGTFNGLPDGATVTIGGRRFTVHYFDNGVSITGKHRALAASSQVILRAQAEATTTTTTLTASAGAVVSGQLVTFSVVLSAASATGTVTLTDNGSPLGQQPLGNGSATFVVSTLAVGPHSLAAVYGGDGTFAGSTSAAVAVLVNDRAGAGSQFFATGTDVGGGPNVLVFDAATGRVRFNFFAYDPAFNGGVRVALGDVNNDGVPDVITAPGPGGGPDVKVFDGQTGNVLRQFFVFAPEFAGGLYLAVGDVNGDGFADVITGADSGGGPNVAVFDGLSIAAGQAIVPLMSFFPFDMAFSGGVRVAAGDVDGDGRADVIAGAGPGGGPNVAVVSGATRALLRSFFPFDQAFTAGLYVAAGDVNGDGRADIITGAGAGGGPNVSVISGADLTLLQSFFPYDRAFPGGVRVAAADRNGDGRADLISVPGPGGGPDVRSVDPLTGQQVDAFFAYGPTFAAGLFVAGSAL